MKQTYLIEFEDGKIARFDFCSDRGVVDIQGVEFEPPFSWKPDMYQPMCAPCTFKAQGTCSLAMSLIPICGVFHEVSSTDMVLMRKPDVHEMEVVGRVSSVHCIYSLYHAAVMFSHCPMWSRHRWTWHYIEHNFVNGSNAFIYLAPFLISRYLENESLPDQETYLKSFEEGVTNAQVFNRRFVAELQKHMAGDANANAIISFLSRYDYLLKRLPDKTEELAEEIRNTALKADKYFIS